MAEVRHIWGCALIVAKFDPDVSLLPLVERTDAVLSFCIPVLRAARPRRSLAGSLTWPATAPMRSGRGAGSGLDQ
jgi:hypothetical protein